MKKTDLNILKKHVNTQYGDLTGVIQIDGHDNIGAIYNLCKDLDVNIEGKFIIGFGLSDSSILGVGQHGSAQCRIIVLDEDTYGSSYDEIEQRISETGNEVKTEKISFSVPYNILGKYIKRFDFLVTSNLISALSKIEIEED